MSLVATCMYRLLDIVHQIDVELRKLGKQKARGGAPGEVRHSLAQEPDWFFQTHLPGITTQETFEVRTAKTRKKSDQPLRTFVRLRGGLNLTKARQRDVVKRDTGRASDYADGICWCKARASMCGVPRPLGIGGQSLLKTRAAEPP
jgi:hypothetical protein